MSSQICPVLPRPAVREARPWAFPSYDEALLDNGIRVLSYHIPGQYVISVRLAVPMPLSREPREVEGVGTIMARSLDEGTAEYDSHAFAGLLERRGVALDAGISDAGLYVSMDATAPDVAYGIDLLAKAVREPVFPDREVQRHVSTRLTDIAHDRANPSGRAALAFIDTYFDASERASRPTGGTAASVQAITAADVRDYHRRELGPAGATIVVAGDLTGIDPLTELRNAFGDWTGGRPAPLDLRGTAPQRAAGRRRIVVVPRQGAVQSEIYVGCAGPDRTVSGGWAPYPALGYIIGGSPTARIDAILREDKGYTYGIRSGFRPRRRGGAFLTSGSVRSETTVESLEILLGLLDEVGAGFSDKEVRDATAFLTKTAPGRFATADAVADDAASFAMEGLTTDFTTQMLQDLVELTPQRLQEAWIEQVPGDWTVVLVGDLADSVGALEALGRGQVEVVEY